MRICIAKLKSATPYSQSKRPQPDEFPKAFPKEKPDDYDARLWREKATYNEDGEVCIPQMALKMSVDEAIKRLSIKVEGRKGATYTKLFKAGQICEADVPIGVMKTDLEPIVIWANSDGVRGSGKRVMRRFPYIKTWSGVARFAILDDIIPNDIFERGLIEAGRLVGIGRFRPENGGYLGRFSVESFDWSEV